MQTAPGAKILESLSQAFQYGFTGLVAGILLWFVLVQQVTTNQQLIDIGQKTQAAMDAHVQIMTRQTELMTNQTLLLRQVSITSDRVDSELLRLRVLVESRCGPAFGSSGNQ